jgi:hypothetical protein
LGEGGDSFVLQKSGKAHHTPAVILSEAKDPRISPDTARMPVPQTQEMFSGGRAWD